MYFVSHLIVGAVPQAGPTELGVGVTQLPRHLGVHRITGWSRRTGALEHIGCRKLQVELQAWVRVGEAAGRGHGAAEEPIW